MSENANRLLHITIGTHPTEESAASLGVGIASASIIYDAYDEWVKKKRAAEGNLLYPRVDLSPALPKREGSLTSDGFG